MSAYANTRCLCDIETLVTTATDETIRSYGNSYNAFVDALMQSSELVAECKKNHKKIPFELAGKAVRAVVDLLSDEDIGKAFKTIGVHYRQHEDWR